MRKENLSRREAGALLESLLNGNSTDGQIAAALIATTQPAAACAGLIGPNGAVNLLRTTTFAGYHNGVEHYVTSFQFAGGSGQFGSLIPLPGKPLMKEQPQSRPNSILRSTSGPDHG